MTTVSKREVDLANPEELHTWARMMDRGHWMSMPSCNACSPAPARSPAGAAQAARSGCRRRCAEKGSCAAEDAWACPSAQRLTH